MGELKNFPGWSEEELREAMRLDEGGLLWPEEYQAAGLVEDRQLRIELLKWVVRMRREKHPAAPYSSKEILRLASLQFPGCPFLVLNREDALVAADWFAERGHDFQKSVLQCWACGNELSEVYPCEEGLAYRFLYGTGAGSLTYVRRMEK